MTDTPASDTALVERLNDDLLLCSVCGQKQTWKHDHKPDMSGLDDGPPLPGHAPRKRPAPKAASEMKRIRAQAWETRRKRYGNHGHR